MIYRLQLTDFQPASITEMFYGCGNLQNLDVLGVDTSLVENMQNLFRGCGALDSINLSRFNTQNVTNMAYMFDSCKAVKTLDLSSFNTQKVTHMSGMFNGCTSLETIDLSSFNTSNVVSMENMFSNDSALNNLDLLNFNTEKVTSMGGMFWECSSLNSLDLSSFNTARTTSMRVMFQGCVNLKNLDLSSFVTNRVTSMESMFYRCSAITCIDIPNFDTSHVTDMGGMFFRCGNLKNIYVSSLWNTDRAVYNAKMFSDCSSLPNYNSSIVDKTNAHFNEGGYLNRKYIVKYISDGEFCLPTYYSTGKVDTPKMEIKDGYGLTGWYTDEMLENEFDFDTQIVSDLTLYAGWHKHVDNLNFHESKNPDCLNDGNIDYYECPVCGALFDTSDANNSISFEDVVIKATGHNWGDWIEKESPKCTENGCKERECSVCGKTETAAIDKLGHNYEEELVAPTCTDRGYTLHTCSRCADSFKDSFVDAFGHMYGEWNTTKEATCTENGFKERECSVCGEKELGIVDATEHLWNEGEITKEATCIVDGVKTYTCLECNGTRTEPIAALGHTWNHYKQAAGLLKNGSEYDQCTRCKIKKNVKTLIGYATYYVKSFKVAKAKKAFTAKWSKQSAANQKKFNGYQIRYSLKSNMSGAKYATAKKSSTSKKISKLKAKKTYYVQVRTYTKKNGTTFYSKWSTKKSVKTK